MKNTLKTLISIAAVMLILTLSVVSSFAAESLTLDNDVNVACGDTVTYTLYVSDCEEPVTDMVAYVFYDSEYLELDKDSVSFHDLIAVNRNVNLDGYIPFNFSISSPVDFSKRTPVFSADFKAKKEGTSSLKYFIGDMHCGDPKDNKTVKEYTFTCDYVVHSADGDVAVESVTPVILDDQSKLDEYQGDFVNYADGKGEQDGGGENHIAVKGNDVIDVTKGDAEDNNSTIIITVILLLIILVVALLLVVRRIMSRSNEDEEIIEYYDDDSEEDENEDE